MASRSLEYKLVEIVNQGLIDPSPEALALNARAEPLDVDGKKGQTLGWVEEQHKYIVETFDGDLVAIKGENLKVYEPPPPAEGGFDLAFPSSEIMAEDFQSEIANLLQEKKYCVVQMPLKQADRRAAARSLGDLDNWARFMPEFEESYMGHRPEGKKIQWFVPEPLMELDGAPESEEAEAGIASADNQLTNLAIAICNVCPYLGFNGVCRSNGMLHMNCANAGEEGQLLDDARGKAVGAGIIQGHLSFSNRRKICMTYFVSGSGGTMTLHPANRGDEDIILPCQEGQVIIFRHDLCGYTYLPEARQLALQAWIFREQHDGEMSLSQPDMLRWEDALQDIPASPNYGNAGKSVDVMSIASRIPGLVSMPEDYWTGLCTGYDGVIRIPLGRWDHDMYFMLGAEEMPGIGKAYTQHKGLLDNDTQMFCFDNEFFGITEEDVRQIDPPARCTLEVGYDCLYRAGWTRKLLDRAPICCVYGTANGEFEGAQLRGLHTSITATTRDNTTLGVTCARLHYSFGMKGRCSTVETACSSSLTALGLTHTHLRPDQLGQMKLGAGGKQEPYGMAMGANGHFDPFYLISLCGAKMLSIRGRCFTFDQSGDGFTRGEGCAGMHIKCNDGEDLARLAMLCGSCMNQDGRSASLTAPHGPSQQECIRLSLREAAIPPLAIQMQELHGTGTALGDPIEVGALRATMMMIDGEIREHPLVKTSSKSNIGHTELCAGMCGIMKCVLMGIYCTACPNNHIRLLNPHIDSNAYPVYFVTESVDQGKNAGFGGVSSFGFGGSNARADIWARALAGPRNTDPGGKRVTFTSERIYVWGDITRKHGPIHAIPNRVQEALDNIKEFDDAYLVGDAPSDDDDLYITGTFNAWTTPEKMTWLEESNAYIFALPIGETLVEQFQIVMNKNENFKIFPATKFADQDALVLGPGIAPAGNNWVIDGRSQGIVPGTVYQVFLEWDIETRKKRISWEPTLDDGMLWAASQLTPFRHKYYVLGSWNLMKPSLMMPSQDNPGTFELNVKIGLARHEEFRFQRDADKYQAIYPARQRDDETDGTNMVWTWTEAAIAAVADEKVKYGKPKVGDTFTGAHLKLVQTKEDTQDLGFEDLRSMGMISSTGAQSVPVCGPDHLGEGKHWMLKGKNGADFRITLRVVEGEITVITANNVSGIRSWTNLQAVMRRKYFVTATWNEWGYSPMEPDVSSAGGVYRFKFIMPDSHMMAFQIVVDEDEAQTIHPEMMLTDQLLSPALGPDAKGKGLYWGIHLDQGTLVEIKLDLAQEDRRKVVTWTPNQ